MLTPALGAAAKLTTLFGAGWKPASSSVTVMVAGVVLSAGTVVADADTVELFFEAGGVVKVTVEVWLIVTSGETITTAVKVTVTGLETYCDLTSNTTSPRAFVIGLALEMPMPVDGVAPRLTVRPGIGLLPASLTVTLTWEVVELSAGTLAGPVVCTEDVLALGSGAVKFTVAVCVIVTPSAGTEAWKVTEPVAPERLTVKVVRPVPSVSKGLGPVMVTPVAPGGTVARVTALPGMGKLPALRTMTLMVDVAMPFASTVSGLADTVEFPALAGGEVNVTVTGPSANGPEVESNAVTVKLVAAVDVMVSVAWPAASVKA